MITIIAALTEDRVIGSDGALPWYIPDEYQHFLTSIRGKTVIMGRTSFEEFGSTLTSAHTVVITRSSSGFSNAVATHSINEAVRVAESFEKDIYIAGGADIYRQMMPLANRMLLSFVTGKYAGDIFFPIIGPEWQIVAKENRGSYTLVEYQRVKV